MKFQSALVAVAFADIEPLKRLNTLVRSRLIGNFFIKLDRSKNTSQKYILKLYLWYLDAENSYHKTTVLVKFAR